MKKTAKVDGIAWTYEVSKGKTEITRIHSSAAGAITVPSTLGGRSVTSIGDNAFEDHPKITSITIPGSVKSIGRGRSLAVADLQV